VVPGPWVEAWLSQPRFDRYLRECGGDRCLAVATYEWNLRLGYSLMRDAAHLEVALRNAYNNAIQSRWRGSAHWLADPASPVQRPAWRSVRGRRMDVNVPNRAAVADAIRKAGGRSTSPALDAVVAQLPFGFWAHLSDAAHEQSVWIPYVYYAWPQGTGRPRVDRAVHLVGAARNLAAHHEPIFAATGARAPLNVHAAIIDLLTMLNAELADHVQQTSTVASTWVARP
jgi:hypothetical protein